MIGGGGFADGGRHPTVEFDYKAIDHGDGEDLELAENADKSRAAALLEIFTRAITEIYDARNSKKSALCLLIAMGTQAAQGRKIVSAARQFGVSKQDISKGCVAWCEFMGIEPSSYMRSQASKESFVNSNKRKQ